MPTSNQHPLEISRAFHRSHHVSRVGPGQRDPRQPDPTRLDPTRPDPTPTPTRPDPTRPDPTRPDPTRPDPTRPDPRNFKHILTTGLGPRGFENLQTRRAGRVMTLETYREISYPQGQQPLDPAARGDNPNRAPYYSVSDAERSLSRISISTQRTPQEIGKSLPFSLPSSPPPGWWKSDILRPGIARMRGSNSYGHTTTAMHEMSTPTLPPFRDTQAVCLAA